MNDIVPLAGVDGVGKTHLLTRCVEEGLLNGVACLEFGKEIKRLLKERGIDCPSKQTLKALEREIIDRVIRSKSPTVYTSHIVFYDGQVFEFDEETELYIRPKGYIYVCSSPGAILRRRYEDNHQEKDFREPGTLEKITEHVTLTRLVIKRLAQKLGAAYLEVKNDEGCDYENAERIGCFVREVLS